MITKTRASQVPKIQRTIRKIRLIGLIARLKTISTEIGALGADPVPDPEGYLMTAQDQIEAAIDSIQDLRIQGELQ